MINEDNEGKKNINIQEFLEPIDIDLDKLFSLSYTFDNLKLFMKNIIKNQQVIADKLNEIQNSPTSTSASPEMAKKSSNQPQDFQKYVEHRLKSIENSINKNKKEIQNLKNGKNIQKDEKNEKPEEKEENDAKEEKENVSQHKKHKKDLSDDNLSSSKSDEYFASNQEIQEIKEKIEELEKKNKFSTTK